MLYRKIRKEFFSMEFQAFKTAVKENTMLCACMDTAKQMIQKKEPIPYKGKNIGIAILDTGISPVDDFVLPYNRIVAFRDFVGKKTSPYDDNGHGTQVPYQKSENILSKISSEQ